MCLLLFVTFFFLDACAHVKSRRSIWSSLSWNYSNSPEWGHVNLSVHRTQTSTFISISLLPFQLIIIMNNSGSEICGWVPPSSNSALLLRMHDRCEWSIINGLGNELWMCNISCNRQLNIDGENIATIAPQIVMWSTWTSRIIIKQRAVFWHCVEDKCRGSVGGRRGEIPVLNIIVY